MNAMTNEETDTALILEGELKRRVREVSVNIVREEVSKQMQAIFTEQKTKMMLEISLNVGQMLNLIEKEGRKPLWESKPEDFGFDHKELNTHMVESRTQK